MLLNCDVLFIWKCKATIAPGAEQQPHHAPHMDGMSLQSHGPVKHDGLRMRIWVQDAFETPSGCTRCRKINGCNPKVRMHNCHHMVNISGLNRASVSFWGQSTTKHNNKHRRHRNYPHLETRPSICTSLITAFAIHRSQASSWVSATQSPIPVV